MLVFPHTGFRFDEGRLGGQQKWLFIYKQRKSQVFALTQNPTTGRFVFDKKLHTSVQIHTVHALPSSLKIDIQRDEK